jgi:SnoaL-like domain
VPIDVDIAVRELTDRAAITEVLHTYARLVDERDFAAAAGVFTDDCLAEYGVRETDTLHSAAAVADWLTHQLLDGTATSHHISNVQISFPDADHAETTSYLYAWHRPPGAAVDPIILAAMSTASSALRPAGASPTAECSRTAWSDFRRAFCSRFPAGPARRPSMR